MPICVQIAVILQTIDGLDNDAKRSIFGLESRDRIIKGVKISNFKFEI
jgi:hypothetical protein